jgi:transcriptional regulator with XRE-family HTH domain
LTIYLLKTIYRIIKSSKPDKTMERRRKHQPEQAKEVVRTLREVREAKGLKQSDVARRLGSVQSRVSEVEANEVDPRLSTVAHIARVLGLHLVLVPENRLHEARQLLGPRPTQLSPTGPTGPMPSVYEELFVPDPTPEDDQNEVTGGPGL